MTIEEYGTLAKKQVYFLCLHNAESFYEIVPKTERRYRFEQGQPYLVKYDEDIKYFRNHLDYVEQGKQVVDPKTEELNEQIADKVQDVIEEDAKTDLNYTTEASAKDIIKEKCTCGPNDACSECSDIKEMKKTDLESIKSYTKTEIKKMNKSEQIKLIQKYKDQNLCNENIPIMENGRIDLILKLQGSE